MALFHLPFEGIDEPALMRLLASKAAEARDIEYKREMYGGSDAAIAECLADLASLANTVGGDLLIGMAATKGVATELTPLSGDPDAEIVRIEEIARAGLQPRLTNIRSKAIRLAGGGYVLLVRVPRSYNPPHRQIRKGTGELRFWARGSNGKYQPDVDELRALFTLAPQLTDRIRDFRYTRLAKIVAQDGPVRLLDQTYIVLHVVPFSAFDLGASISLVAVDRQSHLFPPPGSQRPQHCRINFDGALMLSNALADAAQQRAYVQIFHNGAVEAVVSSILEPLDPQSGEMGLRSVTVEGAVIRYAVVYLKSLQSLGIEPPFAVAVSVVGVNDVPIRFGIKPDFYDDDLITRLDRNELHFAEAVIEHVPQSNQEFAMMIRPIIEQLANAAGRAASPSFDPNMGYLLAFR